MDYNNWIKVCEKAKGKLNRPETVKRDTMSDEKKIDNKVNDAWLKNFKNVCNKYDVDPELCDFLSLDWSLTYEELKHIVLEMVSGYSKKAMEIKAESITKEQIEAKEAELKNEYITELKKAEIEEVNKLEEKNEVLKQKFKALREFTRMTALNHNSLLIITGKGGLGKSHNVLSTFRELNFQMEREYGTISGFSSPLEFYQKIYEFRNMKVILIDDCFGIFEDQKAVSLLKMASWSVMDKRFVSYNSTTDKLTVPSCFEMNANIILITNDMPSKTKSFDALITRGILLDISFTFEEIKAILSEIAKKDYKNTTIEQRNEVLNYIFAHSAEAAELNIRTLIKCFECFIYAKNGWKSMVLDIIKPDKTLSLIVELAKKGISVKEQVKEFCEITGLSRMTYFRYKKEVTK